MDDKDVLTIIVGQLPRQTPEAHAAVVAAIDRLQHPTKTLSTPIADLGLTALGAACYFRNIPAVRKMCELGADTHIRDEFMLLPADWCFNVYSPSPSSKPNLVNGNHAGSVLPPAAHDDLVTINLLNAIVGATKHRTPVVSKETIKGVHRHKPFKGLLKQTQCTCKLLTCVCTPHSDMQEALEHHATSEGAHDLSTLLEWLNGPAKM